MVLKEKPHKIRRHGQYLGSGVVDPYDLTGAIKSHSVDRQSGDGGGANSWGS